MKKLLLASLYVGGVVGAVVIGSINIGLETTGSTTKGGIKCDILSLYEKSCDTVLGRDTCGQMYAAGYAYTSYESNYRDDTFPQCVKSLSVGADGKVTSYETDPNCVFRALKPTSSGCGG